MCYWRRESWDSLELESLLNCKVIHPVHPKGNQSWIFAGRTDAETETPILWPPDAKNWLTGKDPNAGKDWRQEGKGMTEDEMVGWHHRLNGHESEQTQGDGEGQGSLTYCSPWGRRFWHDLAIEQPPPQAKYHFRHVPVAPLILMEFLQEGAYSVPSNSWAEALTPKVICSEVGPLGGG